MKSAATEGLADLDDGLDGAEGGVGEPGELVGDLVEAEAVGDPLVGSCTHVALSRCSFCSPFADWFQIDPSAVDPVSTLWLL